MSTKTKVLLSLLALTVSFASGRFLMPAKVVTVVKTVEVEKKTAEADKHKETTVVEIVNKDGSKETTTKTVEDNKKTSTDDKAIATESTKTVTKGGSRLSIYALGGVDLNNFAGGPLYGAHVSKDILGPISIGLFGLSSGVAGASIGISF